jgi:hypothetical protein
LSVALHFTRRDQLVTELAPVRVRHAGRTSRTGSAYGSLLSLNTSPNLPIRAEILDLYLFVP